LHREDRTEMLSRPAISPMIALVIYISARRRIAEKVIVARDDRTSHGAGLL
jgi:hypothetical protein